MSRLLAILGGVFALSAHASDVDPLFVQMEGHWTGHGFRTYPISGKQVTVDADVQTTAEVLDGKSALLSQNHITETGQTTKTYVSVYWIRPVDGQPGNYELGGQGSTQPSSSGVLGADGVFRVEQDLGGGSTPYVVRSQTVFRSDRTVYTDTFTIGTEIQSQTRIEYQRATP